LSSAYTPTQGGDHGRLYGDVPPIKGVYRGAAEAEHEVKVTMTRL
jgi:hypothetical protein